MQTARTVKKGKSTSYFALGTQGIRFTKKSSDSEIEKIRIPVLEGGMRHGFGDSWDAGARFALIPGTIGVDAKYALTSTKQPLGIALGFGLDYTVVLNLLPFSSTEDISILDTSIPFYISRDFGEASAFYITPRFILRSFSVKYKKYVGDPETAGKTKISSIPMFGASIGVMLHWFAVEYSMISSFGGQGTSIIDQITLGVRLDVGNINHHRQFLKTRKNESDIKNTPSETDPDLSPPTSSDNDLPKKKAKNNKTSPKKAFD